MGGIMNEYFDRTLVADFPILYGQRYGDLHETAMCWGFECCDGWEQIIRDLSQQLEFLNERTPVWVEAIQVKEKYGTLAFYITIDAGQEQDVRWWADIVWALTDAAEMRSAFVCEECGGYGERRDGGWIRTLCDDCWERRTG